jgi:CheY-like chemotaxis protein
MPLPAEQREYVTLIDSSAQSLLRLLNDILDFSKMEAGKLEIEAIEFDLRHSIGATLKTLASTANEKALELICHVAPTVPPLVIGDPVRLAQIIGNLAGNALKFTDKGEVVVRVAPEPQQHAGRAALRFTVADTGIGIARDKLAHIFTAFAQADSSTTREYGGTGLGLAIVSQLIALMEGHIHVESEPGKGTAFHFTIPFDIPGKPLASAAYRRAEALKDMRVLVIDDNRTNRLILGEMFESWGMHAVLAESGAQALTELGRAAVHGTPFRLVLLDSRMPQLGGFQLARAIKSTPAPYGPIVMMLSSNDVAGEIEQCQALGIARFLRKPVTQSELFDAIIAETGAVPDPRPNESEDTPALADKPACQLNVLIAEDHPVNQRLVAEILGDRGHRYSIANNGIEVLQMLDQQSFDVILMDGQMPQMDGYQAAREIRRREAAAGGHVRIIALTAHAMKEDRQRCIAAGMDDYIAKPIDPERLLARVEAGLRAIDVISVDDQG